MSRLIFVSRFAVVFCALAALAVFAPAPRAAGVTVGSTVPVTCAVRVIRSGISSLHPVLQIVATVQTNCNATHDLAFTYRVIDVVRPERLVVTFGGVTSVVSSPGAKSFIGLAPTNSAKELRIRYNGGTLAQHRGLRDNWRVVVTAR